MTWTEHAACRGLDNATRDRYFYPKRKRTSHGQHETVDQYNLRFDAGKDKFCSRCPVRQECLDFALAVGDQVGLFGGQSPIDRRRLLIHGLVQGLAS